MTPHDTTPSLDERKLEQDIAAKKRELDLKEREIAAKEREVATKELELRRSQWMNPTVIGLFAAALGLIGSVVVARVNNQNTQQVEHLRGQSNLVLEAIKTGSSDSACKNLVFFVGLGLLDDPNKTIRNQCASAPTGPPSLPVVTSPSGNPVTPNLQITGHVIDAISESPIEGAHVIFDASATILGSIPHLRVTDAEGFYSYELPGSLAVKSIIIVRARKKGYSDVQLTLQFNDPRVASHNFDIRMYRAP